MTRDLLYLVAASLFILGLRMIGHPRTAVRGNLVGAVGMLVAIAATPPGLGLPLLLSALAIGSALGVAVAVKVKMTAMPEMVGLGSAARAGHCQPSPTKMTAHKCG